MSDPTNSTNPIPQPEEVSVRERDDAMGAYLMMFAALHIGLPIPLLSLLASLIYHFVNAKKSTFTAFHSLQATISQVPFALLTGVWTVWAILAFIEGLQTNFRADFTVFWIFSLITLLSTLTYSVFCVIAAVQAKKGRLYYFPVAGRWAYYRTFVKGAKTQPTPRNEPPKGF